MHPANALRSGKVGIEEGSVIVRLKVTMILLPRHRSALIS